MSASNTLETAVLALFFNNTNFANVGDVTGLRGSTVAGVFYVSLHTADPGEAGTQATSETAYTAYARVSVARTSGGWTIAGNVVSNTAALNFPTATGGTSTVTHFGIGTDVSGVGTLLFSGILNSSLAVSNNIAPAFNAGQLTVSVD